MKLKKLIVLEISLLIVIFISLAAYIENSFYLGSPETAKIGLYNEREFARGNVTVVPGEIGIVRFSYSIYEPTILVLELAFRSVEKPGYLMVRCNNRPLQPFWVSPANSTIILNVMSVSGAEWVEPLSSMFGLNDIVFESDAINGFEGLIDYRIKLRGTR